MDPARSLVSVTSLAPLRDLAPGSLPALQQTLSTWSQRCAAALTDLEAQAEKVKADAVQREKLRRKKERAVEVQLFFLCDSGSGRRFGSNGVMCVS